MSSTTHAAAGMAVWDEDLWREFEASMKAARGARTVSRRRLGRSGRIERRALWWIALALTALL